MVHQLVKKHFNKCLQVFKILLNFKFYNSSVTFTVERQAVMAGVIITFFFLQVFVAHAHQTDINHMPNRNHKCLLILLGPHYRDETTKSV